MPIRYEINHPISPEQFIELLEASSLAQRRPVDDESCIRGMLTHSNLMVSAWLDEKLVGVARSVTDFHYACYLSDLAVDQAHQRAGIGKHLQRITQTQLGPNCKLILLAAPDANTYYENIGFTQHPRCWVLNRDENLV